MTAVWVVFAFLAVAFIIYVIVAICSDVGEHEDEDPFA